MLPLTFRLPTCLSVVPAALAATAVAGFGLISVFWFASFISSTAAGLKDSREAIAAPPPAKPKTLGELIAERKVRQRKLGSRAKSLVLES